MLVTAITNFNLRFLNFESFESLCFQRRRLGSIWWREHPKNQVRVYKLPKSCWSDVLGFVNGWFHWWILWLRKIPTHFTFSNLFNLMSFFIKYQVNFKPYLLILNSEAVQDSPNYRTGPFCSPDHCRACHYYVSFVGDEPDSRPGIESNRLPVYLPKTSSFKRCKYGYWHILADKKPCKWRIRA